MSRIASTPSHPVSMSTPADLPAGFRLNRPGTRLLSPVQQTVLQYVRTQGWDARDIRRFRDIESATALPLRTAPRTINARLVAWAHSGLPFERVALYAQARVDVQEALDVWEPQFNSDNQAVVAQATAAFDTITALRVPVLTG